MTKLQDLQIQYQIKMETYSNPIHSISIKKMMLNNMIDILAEIQKEVSDDKKVEIEDLMFDLIDDFYTQVGNKEHLETIKNYQLIEKRYEIENRYFEALYERDIKSYSQLLDSFEIFLREKLKDIIFENKANIVVKLVDEDDEKTQYKVYFAFYNKFSYPQEGWRTRDFSIDELRNEPFDELLLVLRSLHFTNKEVKKIIKQRMPKI